MKKAEPIKRKKRVEVVEEDRMETLKAKFFEYIEFWEGAFIQRGDIIARIARAILMQEHILLKGKPGVAKSELAMSILTNIEGAKVFKQQFTSFMDESYLFGPQILEELKKGNIVHNTKNSIVDCDFAFLDEFFNANEETIIAGNSVLNEREFIRNSQYEKANIMTAVMTTNRDRETEEKLRPIYDRIIFNAVVKNVEGGRLDLFRMPKNRVDIDQSKKITLDEVKELQNLLAEEVDRMVLDETLLSKLDDIISKFAVSANLYISDRKALKYLKAFKLELSLTGSLEKAFSNLFMYIPTKGTEEEEEFAKVISPVIIWASKYESSAVEIKEMEDAIAKVRESTSLLSERGLKKADREFINEISNTITTLDSKVRDTFKGLGMPDKYDELQMEIRTQAVKLTGLTQEWEEKFEKKRKKKVEEQVTVSNVADSGELDWINELRSKQI